MLEQLKRKGATISLPFGLVRFLKNNKGVNRLLVIISKKTVSSAVKRNKIKRILRESFRLEAGHKGKEGFDFLIICKTDISQLKPVEIRAFLNSKMSFLR
ncbi:MAG: ribonuclease P protein component [Parcubacteria group bacterium]|nr:ribonuclease P protein component [Parcubacteria group bacterium]